MLTAKGSALVAGAFVPGTTETMTVKVLRGFLNLQKVRCAPGEIVTLPVFLALDVIAARKAERVHVDPPPVHKSALEGASGPLQAKDKGEGKHAGK
jgi:hypothetical protein